MNTQRYIKFPARLEAIAVLKLNGDKFISYKRGYYFTNMYKVSDLLRLHFYF